MRKVIRLEEKVEEKGKAIELTHRMDITDGWINNTCDADMFEKIIYLGECRWDGDMFACYSKAGSINIQKGKINDGWY